MSFTGDLQAIACKVYGLLMILPNTRDDDRLLIAEIWQRETKAKRLDEFFTDLISGKISHPESIRRMRQKIQEKHPCLRGDKWEVRHKMENAICKQLTFFDKFTTSC